MDGLGRAIGAPVPIEFNGETLLLDGINVEDFGTIEQHLLAQRPNPLDLARPQAQEFIKSAAALAPGVELRKRRLATLEAVEKPNNGEAEEAAALRSSVTMDEYLMREYVAMAEKVMADARTEAQRKNKVPAQEVAAWLDSLEGLTFSLWLKLGQRYPNRFTLKQTQQIMGAMHRKDVERLQSLRDQASGLDERGNSTGPASEAATGPTGGKS